MPRYVPKLLVLASLLLGAATARADSLPALPDGKAPRTLAELWQGYDPRREPLEVQVVREWTEQGITYRSVIFTVGTFKGTPARMAAFYGFPTNGQNLPAVMHLHGGGQRAFLGAVKQYAQRGYAAVSLNWGGREMEQAKPGDPNTAWGAVDPTQNNVPGYSNLLPKPNTVDAVESPRNNNWFLLAVAGRRGITFLEQQPEVDRQRIGVWGHSMGGRLTGLVAGSDSRVKVASPSVGGSGYLHADLWGLPGSARRLSGNYELYEKTLAGEAYLAAVRCPILFLSATNDFNAPLDFVERGMQQVPHSHKRTVYAPHLNHRFTPETDVSRPLWFDAHLQGRLKFPVSPQIKLILKHGETPQLRATADASREIERVDLYFGYERDPRNRFWADAQARRVKDGWKGTCPVFDRGEPLFGLVNVYYRLGQDERRPGDPETFALSAVTAAYPEALQVAEVPEAPETFRLIDDFARGWHDWYRLSADNPHHWFYSTRKLADPRWSGPRGGQLRVELESAAAGNTLAVELRTNNWRNYAGRKAETFTALVALPQAGALTVELAAGQFHTENGQPLADWDGITELSFQPGNKARPDDAELRPWQGAPLHLKRVSWAGGESIRRAKPFLPATRRKQSGLNGAEFQRAIDRSIKDEQRDK